MEVKAKCIKETYTWEGDGKQHRFGRIKIGFEYFFNLINGVYWLDPTKAQNKEDFLDSLGFMSGVNRGLERKYFNEMFQQI